MPDLPPAHKYWIGQHSILAGSRRIAIPTELFDLGLLEYDSDVYWGCERVTGGYLTVDKLALPILTQNRDLFSTPIPLNLSKNLHIPDFSAPVKEAMERTRVQGKYCYVDQKRIDENGVVEIPEILFHKEVEEYFSRVSFDGIEPFDSSEPLHFVTDTERLMEDIVFVMNDVETRHMLVEKGFTTEFTLDRPIDPYSEDVSPENLIPEVMPEAFVSTGQVLEIQNLKVLPVEEMAKREKEAQEKLEDF